MEQILVYPPILGIMPFNFGGWWNSGTFDCECNQAYKLAMVESLFLSRLFNPFRSVARQGVASINFNQLILTLIKFNRAIKRDNINIVARLDK